MDRVEAQAVEAELLDPIERVVDEESRTARAASKSIADAPGRVVASVKKCGA